jgi:transcriptional regulator with XRE-family HTH domain
MEHQQEGEIMRFGKKLRSLRQAKGLTLRALAEQVDVGFTYLSKIENSKLGFGDAPSEKLIHRLADALDADEEELLLIANKIPAGIKQRIWERPDVFGKLASCDDATLDRVMVQLRRKPSSKRVAKQA